MSPCLYVRPFRMYFVDASKIHAVSLEDFPFRLHQGDIAFVYVPVSNMSFANLLRTNQFFFPARPMCHASVATIISTWNMFPIYPGKQDGKGYSAIIRKMMYNDGEILRKYPTYALYIVSKDDQFDVKNVYDTLVATWRAGAL